MRIVLSDADATARLGAAIAPLLAPGESVLLYRSLGMGKSTLARGLIRALTTPDEDVPSPTFTLVQFYDSDPPPISTSTACPGRRRRSRSVWTRHWTRAAP